MRTKGQVTIFIIVAVLLVAIALSYFIFRDTFKDEPEKADFSDVQIFIQDCVESSSERTVLYSGQGGGFYDSRIVTAEGISYLLINGRSELPPVNLIEKEMAEEFNEIFLACVGNFSSFENYEIEYNEPRTETKISGGVYFEVNFPVLVSLDEKKISLRDFSTNIEMDYLNHYSAAKEFIDDQLTHEDICLTCIFGVGFDHGLEIEMLDSTDSMSTVFVFSEEEDLEDEFEFIFAVQYA